MHYFLKFLETSDHVPYVLSSYFVVFVILIIISVNSFKRLKRLETELVNLTKNEKKKYSELFENYFLKSFSSRLSEYTNPEIDVQDKEVLNEKYTIVNSILKATNERPEIKITWRVYTKDPTNPLIRDLIIEGLSLARTQKEEFASILNSNDNDINALFKVLAEFSKNWY